MTSVSTDLEPSVLASRFSSCIMKSSRLPTGPPLSRMRLISLKCAVRRDSSSSTSTRLANSVISWRMRSSSLTAIASCRRAVSFSRNAASTSGMRGATVATRSSIDPRRSSSTALSFSPSRARDAVNSSSTSTSAALQAERISSSDTVSAPSMPGQRRMSAAVRPGTLGHATRSFSLNARSCFSTSAFNSNDFCAEGSALRPTRHSILPRWSLATMSSRRPGSSARSSSGRRNCRSR